MNKDHIIRSINLYLASAIFLVLFRTYVFIEKYFAITDYIGQFGARTILLILFILLISFFIIVFIKTRKYYLYNIPYYFFSAPYLVFLTYLAGKFWFFGFILFSDSFP